MSVRLVSAALVDIGEMVVRRPDLLRKAKSLAPQLDEPRNRNPAIRAVKGSHGTRAQKAVHQGLFDLEEEGVLQRRDGTEVVVLDWQKIRLLASEWGNGR